MNGHTKKPTKNKSPRTELKGTPTNQRSPRTEFKEKTQTTHGTHPSTKKENIRGAGRVDAVLVSNDLPELGADLVAALTSTSEASWGLGGGRGGGALISPYLAPNKVLFGAYSGSLPPPSLPPNPHESSVLRTLENH